MVSRSCPYLNTLPIFVLTFFLESLAPSSALPIGAVRTLSEMQPVLVDPALNTSGLLNSVLALLAPFNPDESERYDEEILDLHVIGFLVVYVFRTFDAGF